MLLNNVIPLQQDMKIMDSYRLFFCWWAEKREIITSKCLVMQEVQGKIFYYYYNRI